MNFQPSTQVSELVEEQLLTVKSNSLFGNLPKIFLSLYLLTDV